MTAPIIWTSTGAKLLQSSLRDKDGVAFAKITDVTSGAAMVPESQSASFTAAAAKMYLTDTSASAFTATLPSGAANAQIRFIDSEQTWSTNNLTITPASGETIMGLSANESLICDVSGAWVELVWDATNSWWTVTSNGAVNEAAEVFASHDGTNVVTGSAGAVIPTSTPSGTSATYNLTSAFDTIASTDQFVLEIQPGGSGGWQALPHNEIQTLGYDGTNFIGATVETASGSVVIRQGKYCRQLGSTSQTWAGAVSAGTRWRVRKTSGRSVSYPEVVPGVSGGIVPAQGLPGRTDGVAIAAGMVGEYLENTRGVGMNFTSGVWASVDSGNVTFNDGNEAGITLTPGEWDIDGYVFFVGGSGTSATEMIGFIGTAKGTTTTALYPDYKNWAVFRGSATADARITLNTPRLRYTATTNTTIYLKARAVFTGGTLAVYGNLSARRVA